MKNKELRKMYELARETLGLEVQFSDECDIYDLILEMKKLIMSNVIEDKQSAGEKHVVLCGVKGSISNLKLIVNDKINELDEENKSNTTPYLTGFISTAMSILVTLFISSIPENFYDLKVYMGLILILTVWGINFILMLVTNIRTKKVSTQLRYYKLLFEVINDYTN